MKTAVISYSLTGNNDVLASSVAGRLSADHIRLEEEKTRTMGRIVTDMLFNKIPKVTPGPDMLEKYDLAVFVGPVWMGYLAAPLHAYMKHIKKQPRRYAFFSISGGALNTNPKLKGDLRKWTGAEPIAFLDQHIADFLPSEPKPTMKDTGAYKISGEEIAKLTDNIMAAVGDRLANAG